MIVAGAFWLGAESRRHGALLVIGALLGISLYHGASGFTAASCRALARRFAPTLRSGCRSASLIAAPVGGLLMGYGARLGFGCNIGGFFSGVASFSLHGWLWIVCALAGTALGVRLRPLFGLKN